MPICHDQIIYCKKKVAVLLATYNGEKYIREQLDSLVSQTYQDFCCYIHDDGSNDCTGIIIQQYCQKYPHLFHYIHTEPCGGAKNNFMYLLYKVSAEYLMFCDQDDIWLSHKIESSVDLMKKAEKKYSGCLLVHSDLTFIDGNKKIIADSYYQYTGKDKQKNGLQQLLIKNIVVGCTVMINRQLREEALQYQNLSNIYMHDWWVALLASMKGHVEFVDEPLILYRQHESNVTGTKLRQNYYQKLKCWIDFVKAYKQKKEYLNRKVFMAKELAAHAQINGQEYCFLKQLSEIYNKKKIQRIKFYGENNLFEENKNIFWQILWV